MNRYALLKFVLTRWENFKRQWWVILLLHVFFSFFLSISVYAGNLNETQSIMIGMFLHNVVLAYFLVSPKGFTLSWDE